MEPIGTFEWALARMKQGSKVCRRNWWDSKIVCFIQFPDEHSANTEPYIVMQKGVKEEGTYKRFPLDLSCESIFAEDWEEVVE